jgi:Holliday junction resolvase-like predicted endonuclease
MLSGLRRALGRMRVPRSDKALGAAGERRAARLLKRNGYSVVDRNVRLPIGEADLVCLAPDRTTIVVVEVKTRRRGAGLSVLGETVPPEASVHSEKRRKLRCDRKEPVARQQLAGAGGPYRCCGGGMAEDGSDPIMRHHVGAVGEP